MVAMTLPPHIRHLNATNIPGNSGLLVQLHRLGHALGNARAVLVAHVEKGNYSRVASAATRLYSSAALASSLETPPPYT
jgi:hypothetical protein